MAYDLDIERELHSNRRAAPAGSLFETYADKVMRRVDDVLAGRDCPWPITEENKHFLRLLKPHQGKDRAVSLGELCERVHITPRQGKLWVHTLRLNFGVQIGSERGGEDSGYYLVATPEECAAATAPMYAQAISMLRVVAKMRGGSNQIEQLLLQLRLDLNTEGPF